MKFKSFIFTLLALLIASCTLEPVPELEGPGKEEGKPVTINVTVSPATRVAYDGGTGDNALSWESGDQLLLAGYDIHGQYMNQTSIFTYQPGTNSRFSGLPITGAATYKAYYPVNVTLDADGNVQPLEDSFWHQTQEGDNTTTHLRNKLLLFDEKPNKLTEPFYLELKSSILRFVLSEIEWDRVITLQKLIWTVETKKGAGTRSLVLNFENVPYGTNPVVAYLAFDPVVMKIDLNGLVEVMLIGEEQFRWQKTADKGMEYKKGNRYSGEVNKWENVFSFLYTVRVEEGNLDYLIYQQFAPSYCPANIRILWGDGKSDNIPYNTYLSDECIAKHDYPAPGDYTITIESDIADYSQNQMPQIILGNVGGNNMTVTSVLTPFLNMGATSSGKCFAYCQGLTSLPAGLFRYNQDITDFCACFYECQSLTINPDIFPDPTTVPDYFKGKSMSFEACFYNVGINTAAGIAPKLWEFETGGVPWVTNGCFAGANVTNAGDIPANWQ